MLPEVISKGACVDSITFNGTSNLISACANESSDIDVVKILLDNSKDPKRLVNFRIRPQNLTWKAIYALAKVNTKSGINKSVLMKSLSERQGRTALHYAARRGDVPLVALLLNRGADPMIKDDSGLDVKDTCQHFSQIQSQDFLQIFLLYQLQSYQRHQILLLYCQVMAT